jgi:uncharacterized protein
VLAGGIDLEQESDMFVVFFTDNHAYAEARDRLMPQHLDFLERNAHVVHAAGPLRDAEGRGAGGLWLVEATDHAVVRRLVEEDPLWPTGLRESVSILEWKQVFADGKRSQRP